MNDPHASADTKRARRGRILQVLSEEWDPLGVVATPAAGQHYGPFASKVDGLLRAGTSEAGLVEYLRGASAQLVEPPVTSAAGLEESCRRAAHRLRAEFGPVPAKSASPPPAFTTPKRLPLRENVAFRWAMVLTVLVILPFTLLGGFRLVQTTREAARSASWPAVDATVVESGLETSYSTDRFGVTVEQYSLAVTYLYRVDGREYRSERIASTPRRDGNRRRVEVALAAYPRGAHVRAYYDPADPAQAYLRPGIEWGLTLMLAGLTLAMLAGCAWAIRFLWLSFRAA